MKIGVIGLGMVGGTIYNVMMRYHKVVGYDKFISSDPFNSLFKCNVIFICVPTPEGEDGRLDCSIVEEVLKDLETLFVNTPNPPIVVIKSTVQIGFFDEWGSTSHNGTSKTNLKLVYNPEFLHEKKRWTDFEDPFFVVLAGPSDLIPTVRDTYCWLPPEKFEIVSFREAELIKLVMNAFASTKISFWNEMKTICDQRDIDVCRIRDILRKDTSRWTDEYTDPTKGPYGGACHPKDIRELIAYYGDSATLLKAVETVNESLKSSQ